MGSSYCKENSSEENFSNIRNFSNPMWDTCSAVGYAARLGNVDLLETLINEENPVDTPDIRGWYPLHEAAAESPTIDCLKKLLKHGGTDVNCTTREGESALLLACKRQHGTEAEAFVNLLLRHGADPNTLDNEENSPLLKAVRNENKSLVRQLIAAGANVNATDRRKFSPLHEAATKQDPTILQLLLTSNAIIGIQDNCGGTPIFTAAELGCECCLKALLFAAKVRNQESVVNIGTEDCVTPLMRASQNSFVNCVKILLDYGADPDLKTSDNETALHFAIEEDNKVCLEILLEKMNLEPLIKAFHPSTYEDIDMICPVHYAVWSQSYGCLQALLAAGFSPDSLSHFCSVEYLRVPSYPHQPRLENAVSYAAIMSDKTSISILLAAGASCNPPVREGYHPLLRAMGHPEPDIFQLFIESGTDVNYQRHNEASNEVFMHSLLTNSKYLKLLLYYGCDPNLCFQNESEVLFFIKSAEYFLRRESIPISEFFTLMLRFLLISKKVQYAFLELNNLFEGDMGDILDELNTPSSLKQICSVRLRQHLYSIHGVKLPHVIKHLCLAPVMKEYMACEDLKFSPG